MGLVSILRNKLGSKQSKMGILKRGQDLHQKQSKSSCQKPQKLPPKDIYEDLTETRRGTIKHNRTPNMTLKGKGRAEETVDLEALMKHAAPAGHQVVLVPARAGETDADNAVKEANKQHRLEELRKKKTNY